ncbi:hypothetical protein HN51_065025 [Arachis hypogaea]|uniref:Homeobox protein n=1 Tax=Arachis hypogaea TaxID=3818 RepID=A0A444ZCT7_ARAHY|nr:homeobox protein SBH1-like [Arachis ipaensis]XP_025645933.1 homeobox protein SBH1 [Arachis hypogaea]QHO06094.1 Homeobox protein [Arachis hypogaea]RYR11996.1 hypothetical protein Ahy_B04g069508 [Arachis hypogaea]
MEAEGGSSNGGPSNCFMAFGENNNSSSNNNNNSVSGSGLSPMMMMPLVTNSHHPTNNNLIPHQNHTSTSNNIANLFLPMPTSNTNNNNTNTSFMLENNTTTTTTTTTGLGYYFMDNNGSSSSSSPSSAVKAKIMAHPHYHRLLAAYINCQKVGAPPEVVARLEAACASAMSMAAAGDTSASCLGEDPSLDQFMEAYCEMLTKYEQELSKPLKEAMIFLQRMESQFKNLTISSSSRDLGSKEANDGNNGSSEEDVDLQSLIDPQAEDRELKGQLLRKYSGYLGSLKQEFMKKRKKGKLPKEARQQLLEWWSRHYKWPYPSESQKLALAESTGLDQKQINNWFINQRKRHWKPSEDMQFVVVDPTHPHYYMDNVLANPFSMDLPNTML